MNPEYFLYVMYAGLAGVVLSLLVATAYQKWSPRVFFLLALRLAIGWHFLFEGLHKVNSHLVGPTETNKPFSSEPYFRAARRARLHADCVTKAVIIPVPTEHPASTRASRENAPRAARRNAPPAPERRQTRGRPFANE